MSFFQKDNQQKNLQYDNIAFLHFLLTFSVLASFFFFIMIYRRTKQANIKNIKNYQKLNQSGLFRKQIQNEKKLLKQKYITKNFYIMIFLLFISIISSVGIAYYINQHGTKMIGFDPYQILGVEVNSPVNVIKKAYRKLALIYHPDRNPNNPQAHTKFIMISKSYQCLTDDSKKQNCMKFGNPDGQTSFQVGIGLPQFLIKKQNQNFTIPLFLFFILILIPILLIKLSNSVKTKDSLGLYAQDYSNLYNFFKPEFNASYGFYIITILKQLDGIGKLSKQEKQKLLSFISQQKIVDVNYVSQKFTESQMYVLFKLLKQMISKQADIQLSKIMPNLLNSLFKFGSLFAQTANHTKPLTQDKYPIQWIGCQHLLMFLEFIRTYYTSSLMGKGNRLAFDYLDLSPQDQQISKNNPVSNFKEILSNPDKRKQHLSLFPDTHQEYLQKQLLNFSILEMNVKLLLEDKPINQFTAYDFPQIEYKIKKKNDTTGYSYLPYFPYLKEEKYYLLIVLGNNLLSLQQIVFKENQTEIVGKFSYREGGVNTYKITALLLSDCYYDLDIRDQIIFKVVQPRIQDVQRNVQIHQQDRDLEKQQKSSLQKMLNLSLEQPEDAQLSDDSQQQEQQEKQQTIKEQKKKKKKIEMQQQVEKQEEQNLNQKQIQTPNQ